LVKPQPYPLTVLRLRFGCSRRPLNAAPTPRASLPNRVASRLWRRLLKYAKVLAQGVTGAPAIGGRGACRTLAPLKSHADVHFRGAALGRMGMAPSLRSGKPSPRSAALPTVKALAFSI
jgi:hypothetical protein